MKQKLCKITSLLSLLFIFCTLLVGCGKFAPPNDSDAIKSIKQHYIEHNIEQYYIIENITIKNWEKDGCTYIANVEMTSKGVNNNYIMGISNLFPIGSIEKDAIYKKNGIVHFMRIGNKLIILNI